MGTDQDEAGRIKAKLSQARRMQRAGLHIEKILPDPDDWTPASRTDCETRGEAGRTGEILRTRRVDFMHGPTLKPASQHLVHFIQSDGKAFGSPASDNIQKLRAQGRQGLGCAIIHRKSSCFVLIQHLLK